MIRRLRRPLAAALPALLIPALAACGERQTGLGDPTKESFDAVSISGDQGTAPVVKWKSAMSADETTEKTLVDGDGEEIAQGDKASVYLYLANGTTKEQAYSDWDNGAPEELTADSKNLSEVFYDLLEGAHVGDRVAATTTAKELFGEAGNANLGIGNADSVLVILDVVDKVVPPKPVDVPATEMPRLVEKGGKPTGFDFKGVAKPDPKGELERTVLKEGTGETVTLDSTITANYLGMTYKADKPFDESYSKKPAEFALTGVVAGWTYGLEGLKVGSRVLLEIPPSAGYGDKAQGDIPANSTLYFVVDIVSAK